MDDTVLFHISFGQHIPEGQAFVPGHGMISLEGGEEMPNRKDETDERYGKAAQLIADGKTRAEVAETLGIARGTVYNWFPVDPPDADLVARAQEMRDSGMSNVAIGLELNRSRLDVAKLLGPRGSLRGPEGVQRRIELARDDWTALEEIAAALGFVQEAGRRTGHGDVQELLRAIAAGDLTIS